MVRLMAATATELDGFLARIGRVAPDKTAVFLDAVFRHSLRDETIRAILTLDEKFPVRLVCEETINKLLCHRNPTVVLRALRLITRQAPEACVACLPGLLQHPELPVRIMALRTLHRFWPAEALRLLEELIQHDEPARRNVGISIMVQFPFDEVVPALLMLIQRDEIPPAGRELVVSLVASNPHQGFLRRLAMNLVKNPSERSLARDLAPVAANALALADLERGTPEEILHRYLAEARQQLKDVLNSLTSEPGPRAPEAATVGAIIAPDAPTPSTPRTPIATPSSPSPPSPEAPGVGSASSVGDRDTPLKNSSAEGSERKAPSLAGGPSEGQTGTQTEMPAEWLGDEVLTAGQALERVTAMALRDEDNLEAVKAGLDLIVRFKLSTQLLADWVVRLLDRGQDQIIGQSLATLAVLDDGHIQGHVPVLCFHRSPEVASHAVALLVRQSGKGARKRIAEWLRNGDSLNRRAAMFAFMHMDFEEARPLMLATLRDSNQSAMWEDLEKIFLLNPDHRSLAEITRMQAGARPQKVEFLKRLEKNYRLLLTQSSTPATWAQNLGFAAEFTVREKLERIRAAIQDIHFPVGKKLNSQPSAMGKGILLFTLLLVGGCLLRFTTPETMPESTPQTGKKTAPAVIVTPDLATAVLPDATEVVGTLESFDSLNRAWKFKTSDGLIQKVRFPEGNASIYLGQKYGLFLTYLKTTPLGYKLYTVRSSRQIP